MIFPALRRAYFITMRLPMLANARIYKALRCPASGLKVQLGSGQVHYIKDWLNVDANLFTAKLDLWANILDGLPFKDGSVDVIYSHHVIEHLPDSYLPKLFAEMYRALRPGGGVRLAAPHLGNACRKYVEGDTAWFRDFPVKKESVGGRFTNFIFCAGEHVTAFDESYMKELAESAGFHCISFPLTHKETTLADLGVDQSVLVREWDDDFDIPHTIVVEARKPE
jgi:predicted SAM-dependent methyltransferase